jgi:hypothetical protein
MSQTQKITYDDILKSLSMKVENGKLVISRNIRQECERAGIQPSQHIHLQQQIQQKQQQQQQQQQRQRQQQHQQQQQQQQQPKPLELKPIEKLKKMLEEKEKMKQSKNNKLFLPQDIKTASKTKVQMFTKLNHL